MFSNTADRTEQQKLPLWRRRILPVGILVLLIAGTSVAGYVILERGGPIGMATPRRAPTVELPPPIEPTLPEDSEEGEEIVGSFGRNRTFASVLAENGIRQEQIHRIVESTRPVYDLGKVGSGRPFWLTLTADGSVRDFRYPVDDERYLTVYRNGEEYVPAIKSFPYEIRLESVTGAIGGSLFQAVKESGEQDQLAIDLAEIFTWDIDFYTDIQKGDSFKILVEKKYLDGGFVKYGTILAASLTNNGKTFEGYRFQDANGAYNYYDPRGMALRKSFLKSPLKFARITSRFSHARLHPILKRVRPHLGVDYAAPAGTPVVAVGAGTVLSAGMSGGNGKMVRLRHARGYETFYLHLSRIAVRAGARVSQGEIIGYVGSTGLATGPHLDFRVTRGGRFVNPAREVFPPAPPVPESSLAEFAAQRDSLQERLRQIGF